VHNLFAFLIACYQIHGACGLNLLCFLPVTALLLSSVLSLVLLLVDPRDRRVLPAVVPQWGMGRPGQKWAPVDSPSANAMYQAMHGKGDSEENAAGFPPDSPALQGTFDVLVSPANAAVVVTPSSSSAAFGCNIQTYGLTDVPQYTSFPHMFALDGVSSINGHSRDALSGVIRSHKAHRNIDPFVASLAADKTRHAYHYHCCALPGHIISAETGSCDVIVSHDLQAHCCGQLGASSVFSKSHEIMFDWSPRIDGITGQVVASTLQAETKSELSEEYLYPVNAEILQDGVPYKGTTSTNVISSVSHHRICLSRPFVGPTVACGVPKVYMRTNLVSSGRPSAAAAAAAETLSESRSHVSTVPLGHCTVTALTAHPVLPLLVAGTLDDNILVLDTMGPARWGATGALRKPKHFQQYSSRGLSAVAAAAAAAAAFPDNDSEDDGDEEKENNTGSASMTNRMTANRVREQKGVLCDGSSAPPLTAATSLYEWLPGQRSETSSSVLRRGGVVLLPKSDDIPGIVPSQPLAGPTTAAADGLGPEPFRAAPSIEDGGGGYSVETNPFEPTAAVESVDFYDVDHEGFDDENGVGVGGAEDGGEVGASVELPPQQGLSGAVAVAPDTAVATSEVSCQEKKKEDHSVALVVPTGDGDIGIEIEIQPVDMSLDIDALLHGKYPGKSSESVRNMRTSECVEGMMISAKKVAEPTIIATSPPHESLSGRKKDCVDLFEGDEVVGAAASSVATAPAVKKQRTVDSFFGVAINKKDVIDKLLQAAPNCEKRLESNKSKVVPVLGTMSSSSAGVVFCGSGAGSVVPSRNPFAVHSGISKPTVLGGSTTGVTNKIGSTLPEKSALHRLALKQSTGVPPIPPSFVEVGPTVGTAGQGFKNSFAMKNQSNGNRMFNAMKQNIQGNNSQNKSKFLLSKK
jgi:hypothetical protein